MTSAYELRTDLNHILWSYDEIQKRRAGDVKTAVRNLRELRRLREMVIDLYRNLPSRITDFERTKVDLDLWCVPCDPTRLQRQHLSSLCDDIDRLIKDTYELIDDLPLL